jgi:hypothetical protein
MTGDKSKQLRHAAQYSWRFLRNGERKNIMELRRELELIGYNGMIVAQFQNRAFSLQSWIMAVLTIHRSNDI